MSRVKSRTVLTLRRAYRFVNRPYYWYRPSQIAIRLHSTAERGAGPRLLRTAWGSHLYCWPDAIGAAVARTGVYDLTVAEALARLADPGETVIDAGANVGFMSNLLAHTVGPTGSVVSFEPHPLVFELLAGNVARWRAIEQINVIEARRAAVSSTTGTRALAIDPDVFAANKGTASLEQADSTNSTMVQAVCLDSEFTTPIGVLKLDVERHELSALEGATSLLSRALIRDILFEEHEPPPTPVTSMLESHGYAVLGIRQGLAGPILSTSGDAWSSTLWDPPVLLATTHAERARERLKRRGWLTLRGHFNGRVT